MEKKSVFKQVISAFIDAPVEGIMPRDIELPLDVPKIISLLGPRRSGKTHLLFYLIQQLRQTVPAHRLVYVNFEDDRFFPMRLADMDELVQAYYEMYPANRDEKTWFFFDEIQEVPNWEKFVRRLFDTENCRIYLTGSSANLLGRELATALRGRTLPFEVFPLSFKEFLVFNQISVNAETPKGQSTILHWFDRYLRQGGFPELVFLPENLHKRTIAEYLDLMLYRDLSERFSIKNTPLLKYLLKYVTGNVASPISMTKMFNDLKSKGYSLSRNTVYDYLSYLEEAFLVFKIDIWHRSVRAQSLNPSKLYLIDPAFKYAMSIGEDSGRMLENAVFLHLRGKGISPHYVLKKQEVDFYWENGTPTNVCWGFHAPETRKREVEGLLSVLKFLGLKEGQILTRDRTETIKADGKLIAVRPAWRCFLED